MSIFDDGAKSLRKGTMEPVLDYLRNVDLQSKCRFEFLITRNPAEDIEKGQDLVSNIIDGVAAVGGLAADVLVTKFFLQSLEFPSEASYEFQRVNGRQYVKSIVYPDTVKMEFLESEAGIVRRYLTEWMRKVAIPAPKDGPLNKAATGIGAVLGAVGGAAALGAAGSAGAAVGGFAGGAVVGGAIGASLGLSSPQGAKAGSYVFKDNQKAAKRTGMLLMFPRDNSAPLYPRIMFYGLCIKNIGAYTVNQNDNEPMRYTVEFSIDEIKIPQIL
jgi:hypothetical protein